MSGPDTPIAAAERVTALGDSARGVDARAAVFNDAGVGMGEAGITRLPVLAARGVAAATVDCRSARIGDARSMWDTGALSQVNRSAARLGAVPGLRVRDFVALPDRRGRTGTVPVLRCATLTRNSGAR